MTAAKENGLVFSCVKFNIKNKSIKVFGTLYNTNKIYSYPKKLQDIKAVSPYPRTLTKRYLLCFHTQVWHKVKMGRG